MYVLFFSEKCINRWLFNIGKRKTSRASVREISRYSPKLVSSESIYSSNLFRFILVFNYKLNLFSTLASTGLILRLRHYLSYILGGYGYFWTVGALVKLGGDY